VENRCRLLLEVTSAVIKVWGAERVGIRLSPSGTFNDMSDSNPQALFVHLVGQLNRFDLAYLHLVDALESDIRHGAKVVDLSVLRQAYLGTLIVCGGYDKARANQVIEDDLADAVAFGTLFIANPDLVARFKLDALLNTPDPATFYGGDEKGYTDYPALA
jgi:N-ethylmaleimide reductase